MNHERTDADDRREPTWSPKQLRREREARRVAKARARAKAAAAAEHDRAPGQVLDDDVQLQDPVIIELP